MIVGVSGSPRKGATEYVLERALEHLEEDSYTTSMFSVRGKEINYCIHCDYCLKHGKCRFTDDMEELYGLFKKADGIIMATPVYNGGCSAQLKAVIDRTRAMVAVNPDVFAGKAGMAIAVGGDRIGGQELAILQIVTFYTINGVVFVGGGAFGANLGATFWSKDTLQGVRDDEEGFKSLRKTLNRFKGAVDTYRSLEDKSSDV
jgi:multimeric flavodoxin WrbA